MLIKSVYIKNFRSYKDGIQVQFSDLTTFVGPNDIGKSTILEALDIFFNGANAIKKLDKGDINVESLEDDDNDIIIAVEFKDLPEQVVLDDSHPTVLADEYLLTSEGTLWIEKHYPNAGKEKVYAKAMHPTNNECSDLLKKSIKDLKSIAQSKSIEVTNLSIKSEIRKAIWNSFSEAELGLNEILIEMAKEDAKGIWEKLSAYLPVYSLFQADRSNSDNDREVQDPLKEAVKSIVNEKEVRTHCEAIAQLVLAKLRDVAKTTKEKVDEMNPHLGSSLTPKIPTVEDLKWADVFKNVSITGDNDIPLNKRGSGVKRLVLLNFFRAQTELTQAKAEAPGVIYAIEEPETAQHYEHQKMLMEALINLSSNNKVQVILTTHSSHIVKFQKIENIRLVTKNELGQKVVSPVSLARLPYTSLNEINYTAFQVISEEFHNELFGYIKEQEGWFEEYSRDLNTEEYIQKDSKGVEKKKQYCKTLIIRHQIHHPENKSNTRFTLEELKNSIDAMLSFIESKKAAILHPAAEDGPKLS